jgi:hypothetical protein
VTFVPSWPHGGVLQVSVIENREKGYIPATYEDLRVDSNHRISQC